MVLSESYTKAPSNIWKQTLLYVLAFGLGSLVVASLLGFTALSLTEGLLPQPKDRTAKGATAKGDPTAPSKTTSPPKRGSKAKRPRGNPTPGSGADATDKDTEQEL